MIRNIKKNSVWLRKVIFTYILLVTISIPFSYANSAPIDFVALEKSSPWADNLKPEDTGNLFQNIFNTVLAVAVLLAVIMIMYGGVKYMTTDAWFGKEEAKDIIQNAVWGLVLALISYLILYTINPEILNIRI